MNMSETNISLIAQVNFFEQLWAGGGKSHFSHLGEVPSYIVGAAALWRFTVLQVGAAHCNQVL